MKKGVATFSLDWGKCPAWLFEKMVQAGREIISIIVAEYGPEEFIKRISDPVWFQSLGTVLAFDWNSSGLTTILTAALKEAIHGLEKDLGIFICGGKGKTSRKTPQEIESWGGRLALAEKEAEALVYNSKMAAKVDSSLVQDGFQIYHHSFLFTKNNFWAVIQQGMNIKNQTARRYHWFSEKIDDLVVEPHSGIISESFAPYSTLNMTASESEKARNLSVELTGRSYGALMKDIQILRKHSSSLSEVVSLRNKENDFTLLELAPEEFSHHRVVFEDFRKSQYLERILAKLVDKKPKSYEELVATEGVGPKTIRALSLVSEVIYGAPASYKDPARYSFAHGGKDGSPYPVDRENYDNSIEILRKAVRKVKLGPTEKEKALKRLTNF